MSTLDSFASRNFRLFFAGQLVSQIGNWVTLVAQTLLVLELTNSGNALGLLGVAQFGPVLLLGAWAGLVVDRSEKRRMLLILQTLAMLQSLALAAIGFADRPPVAWVYVVALFGGLLTAFENPGRRAFVSEIVDEHQIGNAVSLNSALMTFARIVGPALAGLLVMQFGFGWAFLGDAVSYLAVLVALGAMDGSAIRRSRPTGRGRGQVRDGVRYAWGVAELRIPLLMMALIGTLAFNFSTVMPLFATRDLHGTRVVFTLLMSVVSIGSLAGAIAAARRRTISIRFVGMAGVAFGVTLSAMALAPTRNWAFVLGLFMGAASTSFMTSSSAMVQIAASPSMRGRVLALQSMVFLGSTPIGAPIVGAVAERFGARSALGLGAAAALLAGVYGLSKADAERLRPTSSTLASQPLPASPHEQQTTPLP